MKKIASVVAASLLLAACSTTPKTASTDNTNKAAASNAAATATPSQAELDAQKLAAQMEAFKKDSIYFDFDKFAVKGEFRTALKHEADWMREHKNDSVTLEGNTDDRGSTEYNLALGSERAHAVHKTLVALGVPSAHIKDVSLGEAKPRASCAEEKCWQENRRVDFVHKLD
jgi:peptidoglycan-associated lipoprotein